MAYDRSTHLAELQEKLSWLLLSIETDEKEIRRLQDRLSVNIRQFRAAISERDAVEAVGVDLGESR
jgi:hypothetical protein